jgi:hypothetical protein
LIWFSIGSHSRYELVVTQIRAVVALSRSPCFNARQAARRVIARSDRGAHKEGKAHMARRTQVALLLLSLIALLVTACAPSVDAETPVEPKCYVQEAEGVRVEGTSDTGQTVHWCCTLTCFGLDEMQCPRGEQLTQFASVPTSLEVVKGCEQANADGTAWCCK